MTAEWALPAERCREELQAAKALIDAGLPSQAVSRAYFAAFHAATAALVLVDAAPSTPAGVISALRQRFAQDGADLEAGRILRRLFEDRNDVDYALAAASPDDAKLALANAEQFVDATARWIDARMRE